MYNKRWIGIDGGGTKTQCVLGDEKGNILALINGESSNIHSNPKEKVKNLIIDMIQEVMKKTHTKYAELEGISLCLAGADRDNDKTIIKSFLKDIDLSSTKVHIVNDAIPALVSGTYQEKGIVLIGGTGSIAYGITPHDKVIRVGGWGHILGDEGSGYDIGLKALKAVLKSHDGRNNKTILTDLVLKHFGIKNPEQLVPIIYSEENAREKIAALTKNVFEGFINNDQVSMYIIHSCAEQLCELVETVDLKLPHESILPVVLNGGLFLNSNFRNLLVEKLESKIKKVEIIIPEFPPVVGAFILSLTRAGYEINQIVKSNIKTSWSLVNV